jgi:hypothetical protein
MQRIADLQLRISEPCKADLDQCYQTGNVHFVITANLANIVLGASKMSSQFLFMCTVEGFVTRKARSLQHSASAPSGHDDVRLNQSMFLPPSDLGPAVF